MYCCRYQRVKICLNYGIYRPYYVSIIIILANEVYSPIRRGVTDVKSQLQTHLVELDISFERVEALQKMVRLMEDNVWLGENPVLNNTILDLITR